MENTNLPTDGNGKPKKTAAIPAADIDLRDVSKNVSLKWTATPWLTLQWTTAANFAAKTNVFTTTLDAKNSSASKRPQYTAALDLLETKMDNHLSYVKDAITKKFTKQLAKSYFSEFGIRYRNQNYELPKDQNSRAAALKLMTDALVTHGMDDDEYGVGFWNAIRTEYGSLLALAGTTDSTVSEKVSTKNTQRAEIKKTLNALINVIKGNYPDTYAEQLRVWGFQKEKY